MLLEFLNKTQEQTNKNKSQTHKKMETPTALEKSGYSGTKVTSMLKACLSADIKPHLRLVQLDALSKVDNKYFKNSVISQPEMTLLWNIYWNFVLNDFRFDNKSKLTLPAKLKKIDATHIGLIAFEKLVKDA
jgi:hypothetical protein